MAQFRSVRASAEPDSVCLEFDLQAANGASNALAWKWLDPDTGLLLDEGTSERSANGGARSRVSIPLPQAPGPYRLEAAPGADRSRFITLNAVVSVNGAEPRIEISEPRVETTGSRQRRRLLEAIPKAFVYPVRSLWQNRALMRSMVARDIASRYQGSFFGALWTVLNPLLLMATYFFVFGIVLRSRWSGDASQSGYVLYFLAGMLPWLAFSEAAGRAPNVVLEHRTFVSKLVFPIDTLPANLVIAGLVTELFGLAIFLTGLLIARGSVPATALWLPVILVPQILLTLGVAWILAAIGVFMRDLGQVIGFLLTLGFFLTPICYPEASLPEAAMGLMQFNPIYILVNGYRMMLLESQAPLTVQVGWLWLGSGMLAIGGYGWFHRLRKSFADVI